MLERKRIALDKQSRRAVLKLNFQESGDANRKKTRLEGRRVQKKSVSKNGDGTLRRRRRAAGPPPPAAALLTALGDWMSPWPQFHLSCLFISHFLVSPSAAVCDDFHGAIDSKIAAAVTFQLQTRSLAAYTKIKQPKLRPSELIFT